tara:strand:+ start:558 stop:728 length:171 start_codon:yes stop_codon:yes gene_type:complete
MKDVMIWINLMGVSITLIILIGLIFLENQGDWGDVITALGVLLFLICNTTVLIKDK